MAFDRDATLKKAEKLLRQGRLEPAILEYLRVVDAEPGDWITANTLGDLYVRAGESAKASVQYARIAEHFMHHGFYSKAAALYKKLLKLTPEDEAVQLNLADIAQKQGLFADAKAHLTMLAAKRRARGDRAGAAEIVVRLGSLDPGDFEARLNAARTLEEMGDEEAAAARFRGIYTDLVEKDRDAEALAALREAVRLNPYDKEGRVVLAKAAVAAGDSAAAREYLDRETAGDDQTLLVALLEVELKSRQFDNARQLLPQLLARGTDVRQRLAELAWSTSELGADAAFVLVDALVDSATTAGEFSDAATIIQEFTARVPNHIPALMKLVEVCVDGGLDGNMGEVQGQLADAYLTAGQASEACVIAEDLVAREPWDRAHIERFRRALVMLKVADPDTVIAERLSQGPLTATDLFADTVVALPAEVPVEPPTTAEDGQPRAEAAPQGEPVAPVEPAPQPEKKAPAPVEIDLTEALGDLIPQEAPPETRDSGATSKPDSVHEVFREFREEVDRQSGVDQSAQHMTLGRTYLEMGMPDQAVGSLKTASRAPRFRFEAASLLGRIYKERGDTAAAMEWLERAAEAPAPGLEEGRALLYELGTLVEQSGETARALAIFLELQSDAGEYRDVAQRIERLARVETGG